MPLPPMFGITVSNVSSFWPAGPHPNETLCPPILPANSKAEDLQCGYPQWHPFQICGKRSTTAYGDDSYSWAPATRRGDEGYLEDGDQYIRFAWDPTASLKKDGFTEYIEITFEQSVYLHSVEVGEPRGMGAIVRIKALHPVNGDYFTIWESSTREGDPTIQYRHRTLSEYRIFAPFPICQTTFKTNTVRLELDTYTVKVKTLEPARPPVPYFSSCQQFLLRPFDRTLLSRTGTSLTISNLLGRLICHVVCLGVMPVV